MLAGEEWQREAASAGVRKKLLGSCCMNGKSGRRHNWELTKEMYNGLFKNCDKEWMEREREGTSWINCIFFTLLPPGISQPFESSFEQAHKVQWETFGGATW